MVLAWRNASDFRFRIVGTSGGDDRTFTGRTRAQTHLITGVYTGAVRWGYADGQYQTMTDTGVLPNNPNADFVIGGCGRDAGTPASASKIRMSEVLIFKDALSGEQVDKLEGYLAHKWSLTNRLRGGHPYASVAPTFTDPVSAVDLTLFWGSIDGGRIQRIGNRKSIWAVTSTPEISTDFKLTDTRQLGGMRVI